MNLRILFFITSLFLARCLSAATDYFERASVSFLGETYNLVWSASLQNGSIIADYIPNGPSYTQFENKFSVYSMKNTSFEKVFLEKQSELENGKHEGVVLDFKNYVLNKDEIVTSYTSEYEKNDASLIVQFTVFRYIRKGKEVVVLEWAHRAYKDAKSFKKSIEKHKSKWTDAVSHFDYTMFKLK